MGCFPRRVEARRFKGAEEAESLSAKGERRKETTELRSGEEKCHPVNVRSAQKRRSQPFFPGRGWPRADTTVPDSIHVGQHPLRNRLQWRFSLGWLMGLHRWVRGNGNRLVHIVILFFHYSRNCTDIESLLSTANGVVQLAVGTVPHTRAGPPAVTSHPHCTLEGRAGVMIMMFSAS